MLHNLPMRISLLSSRPITTTNWIYFWVVLLGFVKRIAIWPYKLVSSLNFFPNQYLSVFCFWISLRLFEFILFSTHLSVWIYFFANPLIFTTDNLGTIMQAEWVTKIMRDQLTGPNWNSKIQLDRLQKYKIWKLWLIGQLLCCQNAFTVWIQEYGKFVVEYRTRIFVRCIKLPVWLAITTLGGHFKLNWWLSWNS